MREVGIHGRMIQKKIFAAPGQSPTASTLFGGRPTFVGLTVVPR